MLTPSELLAKNNISNNVYNSKVFRPRLAINFYLDLCFNFAAIDLQISKIKNAGIRYVGLVVYMRMASATANDLTIVDSNEKITYALEAFNREGLNVIYIKNHIYGSIGTINPSDPNLWFTNYQARLEHIASLCTGKNIPYFGICNEHDELTSVEAYVEKYQTIATSIKNNYGFDIFGSYTYSESFVSRISGMLDMIGMNCYPKISKSGLSTAEWEGVHSWYHDLSKFEYLQRIEDLQALYKKPVWITETGCTNHITALEHPSQFTYPPNEERNDTIQEMFYRYFMSVLGDRTDIPYVVIWSTDGGTFTPLNNEKILTLFQQYGIGGY